MADIQDQPPPKPNTDRTPAWELVIKYTRAVFDRDDPDVEKVLADMAVRDKVGRERYGVPLTAHNGRNHLVDAYQEGQDKAVYLRAELDERGIDPEQPHDDLSDDDALLLDMFIDEIDDLVALRGLLR